MLAWQGGWLACFLPGRLAGNAVAAVTNAFSNSFGLGRLPETRRLNESYFKKTTFGDVFK